MRDNLFSSLSSLLMDHNPLVLLSSLVKQDILNYIQH